MTDELFRVDTLRVCYGESEVIARLSLSASKNEIVALMGLNGMGKTTLMKALIGLLPARAGSIKLGGLALEKAAPHERVKQGLAYVPQGRLVFPTLSVEENIVTGLGPREHRVPDHIYKFFPVLREMRKRRAGNLSGGQQQQLAIARALVSEPRMLLLDEPTEGIQPSIVREIEEAIRQLHAAGLTILLVEQYLELALRLADRFVILDAGEVVRSGVAGDLRDESVRRLLAV